MIKYKSKYWSKNYILIRRELEKQEANCDMYLELQHDFILNRDNRNNRYNSPEDSLNRISKLKYILI